MSNFHAKLTKRRNPTRLFLNKIKGCSSQVQLNFRNHFPLYTQIAPLYEKRTNQLFQTIETSYNYVAQSLYIRDAFVFALLLT